MTRRRRSDRGFTLIEVTVATTILGVVLLLVYGTLNTGVRQAADVEARLQTEANVRLAADTFERDVRQAHTGDASLSRISSLAAAQITFYSPDRATPYHIRKISYRMSGTTLQRSVTTSTDTDGFPWVFPTTEPYTMVLESVRNTTLFTFRDVAGAITTDPTTVATVQLDLTVEKDLNVQPGPLSYSTTTEMRGS
jgi:prepilin-type N-terminal cleavage/methylation domain-containing protein